MIHKNSVKELNGILEETKCQNSRFPVEIFPESIQALILDAADKLNYNEEFFSGGILSSTATAIGSSVKLDNGSYISSPILWLTIIGRSGIGKTHPLEFAKKPLELFDQKAFDDYFIEFKKYNENKKEGIKPVFKKFILNDFTPEKLAENLQNNAKGTMIFRDELSGWIQSFNRYNNGGEQQMYLELFNGGSFHIDRKTQEPIRIQKTNLNIIGGMQPSILSILSQNKRDSDGFLSRFLFIYPDEIKPRNFTGKNISLILKKKYESLISELLNLNDRTLKINDEVINLYQIWQNQTAQKAFFDDIETSIQAKLESYVWRLALILEMIHQTLKSKESDYISEENFLNTIKLIEYFRFNALKVYDKLLIDNPIDSLPLNKKELYQELPDEFKRSNVLPILSSYGVSGGSVGRFLHNEKLFIKLDHGHFMKKAGGKLVNMVKTAKSVERLNVTRRENYNKNR